jgi:cobalamin biosynthesis protein CbiD
MSAKIWIEPTGKTLRLVWYYQGKRQRLSLGVADDRTKIELAQEIVKELVELGLNIELVSADSLDGESSDFMQTLEHREDTEAFEALADRIYANPNPQWYQPEDTEKIIDLIQSSKQRNTND